MDFHSFAGALPVEYFLPPIFMATANKPLKVFRSCGVSASLFENQTDTKEGGTKSYYKVTLTKTYRDGDEFKSTSSLSRDDLPAAVLLLQQAWASILAAEASDGEDKE